MEKHVSKICLALDRNQVVQVLAQILAEQAIMPWLLHCENRVKEKISCATTVWYSTGW
jgi:hypothetical protein